MTVSILTGDCRVVLKTLPADSVHSCVTDPPYHLTSIVKRFADTAHDDATKTSERARNRSDGYARFSTGFMGQTWDGGDIAFRPETWVEVLRVLKPGGWLLAFGGSRTYHRMVCAIEDAGFEIRDQIMWLYGSGFPKSHDVSKGIDKAAGAEREVVGPNKFDHLNGHANLNVYGAASRPDETASSTDAARQWEGWGTALKPAHEPIVLARKPLIGTVVENVLAHGTGALNIDGCRVEGEPSGLQPYTRTVEQRESQAANHKEVTFTDHPSGRWPANVIHDGSDEVLAGFPESTSMGHQPRSASNGGIWGNGKKPKLNPDSNNAYGDSGSAARFFYCAKASKADRDEGLDEGIASVAGIGALRDGGRASLPRKNNHPTVKPTDLMRYLCRLITPPGGTVLDPFMGSGSTLKAARIEQFSFIGIDLDPVYAEMARARADADAPLFAEAVA